MSALPNLYSDPFAIRVIKRPIPVKVEFAKKDGVCQTLEGPVAYRAEDAVLTGVQAEHWPVRRFVFEASYQPLPGRTMGEDGDYLKRPLVVTARRLDHSVTVLMPSGGQINGKAGDWLLQYAQDDYGVVANDIFAATYVAEGAIPSSTDFSCADIMRETNSLRSWCGQ
jgi:hypothetical protein